MTDRPLRLGLIGAGRWGQNYIKTLKRMGGLRLARLASSNPKSRGLVENDCDITTDWQAVAGADDLDGVIIATPPALHADMAHAAIAAGNPALVEKPLTQDAGEAAALLEFAERHDAIVHVDHIHLGHPAYRALKNLGLGMGPIHAIRGGAGNWGPFRADTPVLWDWGVHDIALSLDLMGDTPKTVSARIKEARQTAEGYGQAIALQLTFPGGVRADIEISNLLETKKRFLAVHYDRGSLIYNAVGSEALVREPRPDDTKCHPEEASIIDTPNILPLDQMLIDFALAIEKGIPDLAGLRLGVDVVKTLTACDAALAEATAQ